MFSIRYGFWHTENAKQFAMTFKKISLFLLTLCSFTVFSQDSIKAFKTIRKTSYLDSIKFTFKKDAMAACVDSLWMRELSNIDLFDNLSSDIKNINIDEKVDYELSTDLLKERLKIMDAKSPFNIEYNPGLENLIKSFLKNRKKSFERLMAISEYYFPLFEEALAKKNVPLEIKYLAVVESALNPKAVSRVGATGLWQFMYQTGKQYNLNIDSYVDERSDPLKASEAAAQYMYNMYKIFGDWELVLASYNSGAGNVAKAIRRSGGQQNFWNIRKNLPKETQGYVPAFLATMYIYEFHKEHGIVPNRALVRHFETDTVMVKQQISFKQISDLLDIPVAQIQLLNPSFKMNVVPFYNKTKHFLRLPANKIAVFTSNEDKIYQYLAYESSHRERPFIALQRSSRIKDTTKIDEKDFSYVFRNKAKTIFYKVRRGDNLSEIANKYNVSTSSIKKANRLKSNNVPLGQRLKITTFETERVAIAVKKSVKSVVEKTDSKVVVASYTEPKTEQDKNEQQLKEGYYVVQVDDNLGKIAKKFGVTVEELKKLNNLEDSNVMLDTRLKIIGSESTIALIKENIEPKTHINYVVQKDDNLSLIAKKFSVTNKQIQEWNNLSDSNIKFGAKLIILIHDAEKQLVENSKSKSEKVKIYLVQKGDSLFKISQKYPGVTVAEIEKLNGIRGSDLKPGMKLKING
jgi:membrane-bound lytic murein transglycosylase D